MLRTNNSQGTKTCPLLNTKCIKVNCEWHNSKLDRCEMAMFNYNMFKLRESMNQLSEAAGAQPELR